MNKERMVMLLMSIIKDLVDSNFLKLENEQRSGILKANELEEALTEYGGTLTLPPFSDLYSANIIKIIDSPEYLVEYDLWIDNVKSDLTLTCSVDFARNKESIVIESIHVL